ncbi:Transmembrane secretion effector [Chitinasiproducens palmae]|uniref:Multidrug efflux pump Tap n=2 Tax=Chitinasiproducens palmae TaxID=1770053 RepID=A0A1H2PJI6_9BURK|nr:Transmembrane secretion effector [Chitinasiproducens palmae]
MLSVAVGWQIYHLTGSAYALGLVGLAQFLPMVCLTLVVGHVADRFDRRRIVAVCMGIESLAAFGLAAVVAVSLAGALSASFAVPAVYALIIVNGAARAFEAPTSATLVPALTPREGLQRATAWSTSANQTAQILGPALGGVCYAIAPTFAFALAAVLFAIGAVLIGRLTLARRVVSRTPVTLASVFSGVSFIRSQPVVLGTLSLDLFAVLLGGATALMPIFARDILAVGPWGLGVMRSAPAVGALAMSVWLGRRPLSGPIGRILFGALILFGLATVVFAFSRSLPLTVAALVVLGAADSISVVVRITLVQLLTPDEMLGRVSAVNTLFVGTSNQLGEFESGVTAGLFGTVAATAMGGVGTILVSLLWMRLFPQLRDMRSLDGSGPEARR